MPSVSLSRTVSNHPGQGGKQEETFLCTAKCPTQRNVTRLPVSYILSLAPHVQETLNEVKGPDATPPYLMESSTSFSSSSISSSQQNPRLHQQTADASRVSDTFSTSSMAHRPSIQMPYVPQCYQSSENMNAMPQTSAALSSHQNAGVGSRVLHCDVYCDGPKCRGATQCIVGPRYTCANCPPSIDLCEA